MIELEVYARGLRSGDAIQQLSNQMDLLPQVRCKIDERHDLVYFEIDDAQAVSLRQLHGLFSEIGLEPRFVGQIPTGLRADGESAE